MNNEERAHSIVWSLERDYVAAKVVCEDADCISRYTCDQGCEVLYEIRRDERGVTHALLDWEGDIKPHLRHLMVKVDHCNVVEFLNATGIIPELNERAENFEIGRTPIVPVWQGEDGVTWERPTPPTPTGEPR